MTTKIVPLFLSPVYYSNNTRTMSGMVKKYVMTHDFELGLVMFASTEHTDDFAEDMCKDDCVAWQFQHHDEWGYRDEDIDEVIERPVSIWST